MEKKYYKVQCGDINFCEFLNSIGLYHAKSKTIGPLSIPDIYFRDFFRGCIDGDGSICSFKHPESKYPQLRLSLVSASKNFIYWIFEKLKKQTDIKGGWISKGEASTVYSLVFGKGDSLKIIKFMYYDGDYPFLKRKRMIADGHVA